MDASLNFAALVETNPIVRLTQTYNNKFVNKIKETFTETQQQLFVASLYCFLNHHPTDDFVIDFDTVWTWMGFTQKVNAKRVLEKHFILNTDYKILLFRSEEQKDKHGGHNKETIMLNILTFKRFCIKADTKKANEIHEYFINLEELLQTIVLEESNELKLQLEQVNHHLVQTQQDTEKRIQLERQKMLLRDYGSNVNVVYIARVKEYPNGEYVIKIGESRRGVEARYNEHKVKYDEPLLLDCFPVKKCKDFERFLHTHQEIRPHNVKDLPGHETETELFRIGRGLSYQVLQRIIRTNLPRYNELDEKYFEDMLLSAMKHIQQPPNLQMAMINDLCQQQREMMRQIQVLEQTNREVLETLKMSQTNTQTRFHVPKPTLGPRLQQINPDTMTLYKVYESVTECLQLHRHKFKRPSIDKAVQENTVYQGYRWNYVNRDQNPHVLENLIVTKPTRPQNLGYIAQLDQDKSRILNVYLDRKTAAVANGYSMSGLDTYVKKSTMANGHYYILYEHCSDNLRAAFEELHGAPTLYKNGVGQFNTHNELIRVFVCKYDCIKQLNISDKTLAKALDKDVLYQEHYFRALGAKTVYPTNYM